MKSSYRITSTFVLLCVALTIFAQGVAAFDISFPLSQRIPDDYDPQNLVALLHLNDSASINKDYSQSIGRNWNITNNYAANTSCDQLYTLGASTCGSTFGNGALHGNNFSASIADIKLIFNTTKAGNGMCLGGWFKRTSGSGGSYDHISALGTGTIRFYSGTGAGDQSYYRVGGGNDETQAPVLDIATWNHWALNLNYSGSGNGNVSLYVNGTLIETTPYSSFTIFDGGSKTLRVGQGVYGNNFDGEHSEFFMFNRSCNVSEIQQAANGTLGAPVAPPPASEIPANVSVRNAVNLTAIPNFNVTFANASNASMMFWATTGNVVVNLSDDQLYNVTVQAQDHFDLFLADYNLTASQENNFTTAQGVLSPTIIKLITKTVMTNWTAINQNATNNSGNAGLYVNVGLNQVKLDGQNFTGTSFNYTLVAALSNVTGTFNVTDTTIRISAKDAFTGAWILTFNATANTTTNNYSTFLATSSGNITFETENITNLKVFVDAPNYTMDNTTANMTTNQTNITLGLIMTNMLNASVLSEPDRLPILNGSTITVLLIGESYATNISVTNVTGNTTFQLDDVPSGEYEIIYAGEDSGFEQRRKWVTITSTGFASTDLYLLSEQNSTRVDFTVTDQYGDELENATIKAQRYYYDINGFLEVEAARTNFLGQAVMHLKRYDVDYRFVISVDGRTIFQSSKTEIQDSPETFNFQVNTDTPTLDNYQIIGDVHSILNYSNTSTPQYFQFLFSDANSQISQGCLKVTQLLRTGNNVTQNCLTGSSGTIQISIDHTQNSSWIAQGSIINLDGEKFVTTTMEISTDRRFETFGVFGLFIALGIVLFLAGIGASTAIAHPAGTILLTILGIVGVVSSGIIFGMWTSITLLVVIGAIIIFKSRTA